METRFNWHSAAKLSGRIDFSFTRSLPASAWIAHLKSLSLSEAKQHMLWSQTAAPDIPYLRLVDSAYPKALAEQPFAPPVLYYAGRPELLQQPALSIVGSRKSTLLVRQFAKAISSHAATIGYAVVSGLAYGIDEAAHRGALNQTIGIMGQGILAPRNPSRKHLCEDIIESGGLLISEFPPDQGPQKWSYLHRNRLIAWLGNPFILAEAAERSGAMNTTHIALNAQKTVYVVPHHPLVSSAQGSLSLLLEGAQPLIHPCQLPTLTQSNVLP